MLTTEEEIQKEIEKCKKEYEKIEGKVDHLHEVDFHIENCEIEAMREFSHNGELDFWEHSNRMTCSTSTMNPEIRLFSPEIEVEEHKVESYAYKNI